MLNLAKAPPHNALDFRGLKYKHWLKGHSGTQAAKPTLHVTDNKQKGEDSEGGHGLRRDPVDPSPRPVPWGGQGGR